MAELSTLERGVEEAPRGAHKADSNLERVLSAGHFAVTAELGPPKGSDADVIRRKIGLLKGIVDAANITDNQTAIVRMSSIAGGIIVAQNGLEPVIQMTCRDRNRLAMQSDLLGAAAFGIRNVLCLSGDHQSFGNHPTAKNVYDIDSMQLVHMVKQMRDAGTFECGEPIAGKAPRFFIGVAANPFADPFEWRAMRLAKKVAAGADFVQTQLIYDMPRFKEFMSRVVDMGLHRQVYILAGVGPLKSSGMAKYLRDKVPGLIVADEYIRRMEGAVASIPKEDKTGRQVAWQAEGIAICIEQIQQLRKVEGVSGVHIMGIEWEEAVHTIVEGAGLLPRPQMSVEETARGVLT